MRRSLLTAALLLLAAACREPGTIGGEGELRFEPERLELGATYTGKRLEKQLFVRNTGRASQAVTWTALAPPFTLVSPPASIPAGGVGVTVLFEPTGAGDFEAVVEARTDTGRTLQATVVATGFAIPQCPSLTCHQGTFDLQRELCIDQPVADGTPCEANNACVTNTTCQQGRCRGTAEACDDGNACTIDACSAIDGCQSFAAPPCVSNDPCKIARCDPAVGCVLDNALDGTLCDTDQATCEQAKFCRQGACTGVGDPPDGFMCREATPCATEGRCLGAECVSEPKVLAPTFTFDAARLPDGIEHELHDFVLEPSGAISLSGWFARPYLRINTPAATPALAQARRCILWNARTLCLDYPWPSRQGKVAMLDLATGQSMWRFDMVAARPDFANQAATDYLYLARIAVLGTDRFAALFEAYPRGVGLPTNCRMYFLGILDAGGALLHARRLEDPLLERCDHPHPYGFSADLDGNLFIAFSPSLVENAPLEPGTPTVVLSYTRDLEFRWKRDLPIRGGELAVAGGVLYPEQGETPLDARSGAVLAPVTVWGRAVASATHVVSAPPPLGLGRGERMMAFPAGSNLPSWTYRLPTGMAFDAYEIRLAEWQPRREVPRETVVLAFVSPVTGGPVELHAVRLRDGKRAWMCPLDFTPRGPVDLFEVDQGHLALMEGTNTCGRCDPPFAHSRATFHVFDLKPAGDPASAYGIAPANVPWPGTFGGPAHDGRELPVWEGQQPPLTSKQGSAP